LSQEQSEEGARSPAPARIPLKRPRTTTVARNVRVLSAPASLATRKQLDQLKRHSQQSSLCSLNISASGRICTFHRTPSLTCRVSLVTVAERLPETQLIRRGSNKFRVVCVARAQHKTSSIRHMMLSVQDSFHNLRHSRRDPR